MTPTLPRWPDREETVTLPAGHDARPALQQAIFQLHTRGGGRLRVPAGDYDLHGPIRLWSGVNLHLSDGCLLRFSGHPPDFLPPVAQRWEGVAVRSHSPLITACGQRDIGLTGSGRLDGQGARVFAGWQPQQRPDQQRARTIAGREHPEDEGEFGEGTRLRPSFFQPLGCERVLVEGVTFTDAPFWVLHPTECTEVTIRGVTVDSRNPNNDGCDPDSCRNVLIEDCTFRTGDDSIALKSGRDYAGRLAARPTENVVIRRCRLDSTINGVCLGSELSGGIRHVHVTDCTVENAASAIYLKTNGDRGGEVSDILVENLLIQRTRGAVIRLETRYHGHRGGNFPTGFRDITIRRITCRTADGYGLFLRGWPDRPVERFVIENVTLPAPAVPVWTRSTAGVRLSGVTVSDIPLPDGEPPESPGDPPLPIPM